MWKKMSNFSCAGFFRYGIGETLRFQRIKNVSIVLLSKIHYPSPLFSRTVPLSTFSISDGGDEKMDSSLRWSEKNKRRKFRHSLFQDVKVFYGRWVSREPLERQGMEGMGDDTLCSPNLVSTFSPCTFRPSTDAYWFPPASSNPIYSHNTKIHLDRNVRVRIQMIKFWLFHHYQQNCLLRLCFLPIPPLRCPGTRMLNFRKKVQNEENKLREEKLLFLLRFSLKVEGWALQVEVTKEESN